MTSAYEQIKAHEDSSPMHGNLVSDGRGGWECAACPFTVPSLHEQRLQAVREHSPAVQDGPYAYLDRDA